MTTTATDGLPFVVERTSRAVTTLRLECDSQRTWEQWFLLSSDHHWDNPDSDQNMIRRHLLQARERKAGVFVFGDLFCFMQGKYDKRADKSKVRPEHQFGDYIDRVINTAAEFYGEFADVLTVIAEGNHETAISNRHETDVTTRLVERINALHGGNVVRGGYGGWVRFHCKRGEHSMSRFLKFHHGAGGGGEVTRGVIQTNRQAVYLPDAHVVVNGHTHDQWHVTICRERINSHGTLGMDEQHHVRCPSYKDEYKDGHGGWHVGTWKPPKPTGAWWMRMYWHPERGVEMEFTQAK